MNDKENQQHTAIHDMLKFIRMAHLQYNTVSMGRKYIDFYYNLLALHNQIFEHYCSPSI